MTNDNRYRTNGVFFDDGFSLGVNHLFTVAVVCGDDEVSIFG